MAQHGHRLLDDALNLATDLRSRIDTLTGIHVLEDELIGAEASHDLDRLHVLMDVQELGISGYQAADWLRTNCTIDVGLNDHRRIEATLSTSDDESSAQRLMKSLQALCSAAKDLPRPSEVRLPRSSDLEMKTVKLPRDAFFGPVEVVPVEEAAGRIAAEQITPYPPGVPAILPGERINAAVLEYLVSGKEAGMVLPDPADPSLKTIRVVPEPPEAG
jgi:arginine/lysine/ornithine decarboxylase